MNFRLIPALLILATAVAAVAQQDAAIDVLKRAQAKWNSIQDYTCKMQSNNRLGAETDKKQVQFQFKRKHQVRLEVLDGEKKGSALTRNDQGVIRGKKGGILGVVAVTLDEGDERTLNLRGRKFYDADWGTVLSEFIERVQSGWQVTQFGEEVYNNFPCYKIEIVGTDPRSAETKDIVWVDKERFLVLRRQQYEGTNLVNEVVWWDIVLNSGLDDGLFKL
jgi:outer membrane lipoprotein-sorting protein